MSTNAVLYASVAGGTAARGHILSSLGASVQFSRALADGVRTCRYELIAYPPNYPCPSGWTDVDGVYQYTGESPPPITLSLWGKYLPRLRLNGVSDVDTTGHIDTSTGIEIISPSGMRDLVRGELDQFGGVASSLQQTLRAIDSSAILGQGEPGLIEMLDADMGLNTVFGYITEWRGRCGHVARPITKDMVVDETTLSGGRRSVAFNGTTHGMTLELPELRRNNTSIIVAMHLRAGTSNDLQCLISLPKSEDDMTSVIAMDFVGGGYTTRTYGHFTNDTTGSVVNHTDPYQEIELVLEGVRDSYGFLLHLFRNGVRRSGDEGTAQIDVLTPQPPHTTLYIGHDPGSSSARFGGVIRRIAIYGGFYSPELVDNAAARDALWRNN